MDKIEITPKLLAELKEKAEKATPGPWNICAATIAKNSFKSIIIHGNEQVAIVKTPRGLGRPGSTKDIRERDAAYIAASNPSVILALIEAYENKQEALYGMFLLVNQLKVCLNLDTDAGVEEAIQGAISRINALDSHLSGAINALTDDGRKAVEAECKSN